MGRQRRVLNFFIVMLSCITAANALHAKELFKSYLLYASPEVVSNMTVADFDADGRQDIAVASRDALKVNFFLNKEFAVFESSELYLTELQNQNLYYLFAEDWNKDGISSDLLVMGKGNSSDLFFIFSQKGGTWAPDLSIINPFSAGVGVMDPVVGDFNNDQHPDIAFVSMSQIPTFQLQVFLNQPNGFIQNSPINLDYSQGDCTWDCPMAAADINQDGNLDVVFENNGLGKIRTYLGNGDGSFATPKTFDANLTQYASAIELIDWNSDGFPDLTIGSGSEVLIYENLKTGGDWGAKNIAYQYQDARKIVEIQAANPDGVQNSEMIIGSDSTGTGDYAAKISVLKLKNNFQFDPFWETTLEKTRIGNGNHRLKTYDLDHDGVLEILYNAVIPGIPNAFYNSYVLYHNTPPVLSAQSWDASTKKIRVTYTDKDNERPFVTIDAKIEVLVDGQAIAMTEVDAADTDATAAGGGKIYEAKIDAAAGVHKIAFFATDGTYPATGDLTLEHDFDLTPAPSNGGGGGCTLSPSNDAQSSASNSKSSGALFFIVMGSGLAFFVLRNRRLEKNRLTI